MNEYEKMIELVEKANFQLTKIEAQMDTFAYSVLSNDLSFVHKMLVDRIGLIE